MSAATSFMTAIENKDLLTYTENFSAIEAHKTDKLNTVAGCNERII